MKKKIVTVNSAFLKRTVFVLIGVCCYMYSIFAGDFAEWNISLPFLDFPIFIGEILLFVCVALLMAAHFKSKPQYDRRVVIVVALYIGWVLVKALTGYLSMGPLALRNAALFYYPLFFIIGFMIFERNFWSSRAGVAIFAFFCLCLVIGRINDFFILTYSVIVLGFALSSRHIWLRWAGPVLVVLHAYFSKFIFCSSRAHLLGMAVAAVFVVFYFVFCWASIGRKFKIGLSIVLAFVFVLVLFKFGDRNTVRSLTSFNLLIEQFNEFDRDIQLRKKFFTANPLKVELYNKNFDNSLPQMVAKKGIITLPAIIDKDKPALQPEEPLPADVGQKIENTVTTTSENFVKKVTVAKSQMIQGQADAIYHKSMELMVRQNEALIGEAKRILSEEAAKIGNINSSDIEGPLQDSLQDIVTRFQRDHDYSVEELKKAVDQVADFSIKRMKEEFEERRAQIVANVLASRSDRSLQVAFNNIYFRAFIWRDMMEELWAKKAFLGVNFGQPQRSPSLEILDWASVEWRRDGWITPHNSYLHMIYRGGLVGLALVVLLFYGFINLTIRFLRQRSVWGGLLLTALIYWGTITNFLVFLEFPYNAIPFWTLFGMTWAYANSLEREVHRVKSEAKKIKKKK